MDPMIARLVAVCLDDDCFGGGNSIAERRVSSNNRDASSTLPPNSQAEVRHMDLRLGRTVRATRISVSRLLLALSAPILFALPLGAQATGTVSGRVTEASTGLALQGVSVFASGTTSGALTRADGTYRFNIVPGRYEIRSRFLGYAGRSETITVADGQTVNL